MIAGWSDGHWAAWRALMLAMSKDDKQHSRNSATLDRLLRDIETVQGATTTRDTIRNQEPCRGSGYIEGQYINAHTKSAASASGRGHHQ